MENPKRDDEIEENLLLEDGFSIVDVDVDSVNSKVLDNVEAKADKSVASHSLREVPGSDDNTENPVEQLEEVDNSTVGVSEEKGQSVKAVASKEVSKAKVPIEQKEDSLIITTEEDLESVSEEKLEEGKIKVIKTSPPLVEKRKNSDVANIKTSSKKSNTSGNMRVKGNILWVSNLTRHVKASNLKKFFNQQGNVLTVKILTNGKAYFGYVCMEAPELVAKCIKYLNDTMFEGRKINITTQMPAASKKNVEDEKKIGKNAKRKVEVDDPLTKKCDEKNLDDHKKSKVETDWRKKFEEVKNINDQSQRRLLDTQRKLANANSKLRSCEREIKHLNAELRNDRRKFNRDLEVLENKNKQEQARFDADRVLFNKELEEVRRLRDHFKSKVEELKARPVERPHKPRKSRSNTPPRFSNKNNDNKKRKWLGERNRTPPPPPKLTEANAQRKIADNRRVYNEKKSRRPSLGRYEFEENRNRHRPTFGENNKPVTGAPARNTWSVPYVQEPWRLANNHTVVQFPNERFCGAYQMPSSFASSSREVYPSQDYSKHYDPGRKY